MSLKKKQKTLGFVFGATLYKQRPISIISLKSKDQMCFQLFRGCNAVLVDAFLEIQRGKNQNRDTSSIVWHVPDKPITKDV